MVRLILHRALYLWQGKGGPIHKIPQGMRWLPVGHSLMQQLRHQVKGFRIPATPEHYMFADIRTGQQFSFVVIALLLKQPLQFRIAGRFILVYVGNELQDRDFKQTCSFKVWIYKGNPYDNYALTLPATESKMDALKGAMGILNWSECKQLDIQCRVAAM